MFNNLIESSSHSREFKRRGSFVLGAAGVYVLTGLFVLGIAIWTAQAQMDAPEQEMGVTITPFSLAPEPPKGPDIRQQKPKNDPAKNEDVDRRRELIADLKRPDLVPDKVSAKAPDIPPVRPGVKTVLDDHDSNAVLTPGPSGDSKNGTGGGTNIVPTPKVVIEDPPPQAPKPRPQILKISGGPINGRAILLPKPMYPPIAKQFRVEGTVAVQVLIDETGKVVSATIISGDVRLCAAAVGAARDAKFTPTKLSGEPVKVLGIITYNFKLQ